MNKFILEELNAVYAPDNNALESVSSQLIGYPTAIPPGNGRARRLSNDKMGTEMLMEVKLTFDNEPSPDASELDKKLKEVMFDLSYFVTNLTAFGDPEFANVTEAYRREIPTEAPTQSLSPTQAPAVPPTTVDNISTPGGIDDDSETLIPTQIAIPAVLVAATLVALILFLVVRRRKRSSADNSKSEDAMLTDAENGLSSFDKSLDSSRPPSPDFPSSSISEMGSQDSIFSENIADASKRLKKTGNSQPIAAATPNPNRMYNLMTFIKDDNDITVDDGYSPELPGQSSLEKGGLGGLSNQQAVEGALSAHNEPAEASPELVLHGGVTVNSSPEIVLHGGVPVSAGRETAFQNKQQDTLSGGISNLFQCSPAQGTLVKPATSNVTPGDITNIEGRRFTYDKTPLVRNSSRDTDKANGSENSETTPGQHLNRLGGNQDIFRSRASEQEGSDVPNRSRSATPNRSRPGTPNRSRASTSNQTPSRSRTSTPNRSRQTTPSNSRPITPNRSRTSTPNRSRNVTSERMPKVGNGQWVGNEFPVFEGQPKTGGHSRTDSRKAASSISGYGCNPCVDIQDSEKQQQQQHQPRTPENLPDVFIEGMNNEVFYPTSGRRHAGNNSGVDGSAMYQANAMDPLEWSYKSYDNASIGNSTISEGDGVPLPRQIFRQRASKFPTAAKTKSPGQVPPQDVNWIKKRITSSKKIPLAATIAIPTRPLDIDAADSLSYASTDNDGYALNSPSELYSSKDDSVMSSIVCRDCYAPPGKLNIIIHSTKDGPAVHTVKKGSTLEGHMFPGDLIISVDNVDTRSFTAEHVMKMMAAKSSQERKITVLHFEEESQI